MKGRITRRGRRLVLTMAVVVGRVVAIGALPLGACAAGSPDGVAMVDGGGREVGDASHSGADATTPVVLENPRALISPTAWTLAESSNDPFAGERVGRVPCGPADFREELDSVEIETRACNYLTLTQPALADVAPDQAIALTVWWQDLALLEPAVAQLAFVVGTDVLWQDTVAIPGKADYQEHLLNVPRAIPAGTPVFVHVRNHGMNHWHFGPIQFGDPSRDPSR